MKKKLVLALAVIALCCSILASATVAYFVDRDTARNVITSGGVDITIVEQRLTDSGLEEYPAEPIQIMPGTTASKIVSIRSEQNDAYIRASFTVTVLDAAGVPMALTAEQTAALVRMDTNTTDWTERDGWWYYGKAVSDGDMTQPLFREVTFDGPSMTNEYQNCTVQIDVTAQSVQQANNGASALEAAGWPEA